MTLITPNPTIDLLGNALKKLGYVSEKYELRGSDYTRFIAPNGNVWFTQDAHIGYPFISRAVRQISGEKDIAYEYCALEGVHVPRTNRIGRDYEPSHVASLLTDGALVVKPHNSSLSFGVTLNVRTLAELQAALSFAHDVSQWALVQEQVEGEEIRFAVVDGIVKAALLREMPRLVGDGTANVAALLAIENAAREKLVMPYLKYPQLTEDKVLSTGKKLDDVLADGEVLNLGKGTMVRLGASIYNVLSDIDPSYISTVERLVQKIGARFIVVDMMLHDYTRPQTDTNYAFIEFNSAPVLKLFYSCRDGKHYDIISDLAPMIDAAVQLGGHNNV